MWHRAEKGVRPPFEDKTSSKVYVRVAKNIEEVHYTDEEGNEQTKFVYDEAFVKKEDYDSFKQLEQQKADIEFLSMMTGVDL